MSEYALYDFTESLNQVDLGASVLEVIKAWGRSPEGHCSWEGGFVLRLADGRYAYLTGWCDTTGWGCQDGTDLVFSDTVEGLGLPSDVEWDVYPADLNLWIKKGCPDPYAV
jgi:hypothetical protein